MAEGRTSRSTAIGSTRSSPSTGSSCSGRPSRTSPTPRRRSRSRDTTDGGTRSLAGGSQTTHVIKIYYSFYNLNNEWVAGPGADRRVPDPGQPGRSRTSGCSSSGRSVRRLRADGDGFGPDEGRETIVVRCSYAVQGDKTAERETRALRLSPELYTKPAVPFSFDDTGTDRFTSIFDEDVAGTEVCPRSSPGRPCPSPPGNVPAAVAAPDVVTFNTPAESSQAPWFSFDYKGGSFLCKTAPQPAMDEELLPVSGGQERLPDRSVRRRVYQPGPHELVLQGRRVRRGGPGQRPGRAPSLRGPFRPPA